LCSASIRHAAAVTQSKIVFDCVLTKQFEPSVTACSCARTFV
jgi:hypothetical protein